MDAEVFSLIYGRTAASGNPSDFAQGIISRIFHILI